MTESQRLVIIMHLEYCRESAILARNKFKDIRPIAGSNYIGNQYVYWKNVASGMKWAINMAKQMEVDKDGENRTSLQQSRPDTSGGW